LDRFLAIKPRELILELRRLKRLADFLFTLVEQCTFIRTERRFAAGQSQSREALAQGAGGSACGGGWIIQLVGQPGGQLSQRGEFLPLLLLLREGAHAIGEHTHQALG